MALYIEEEDVYKCTIHPSKRRRTGICPHCLKERLSALCPDCATTRPCACYPTTSSSSSASSSCSARVSNLIDGEPGFGRSKSSAFPFFRSARFSTTVDDDEGGRKVIGKSSFWSGIWWYKNGRKEKGGEPDMRRSRSVATTAVSGGDMVRSGKGKGWYFPSPMKVFRRSYSKTPKFVHERSVLHQG